MSNYVYSIQQQLNGVNPFGQPGGWRMGIGLGFGTVRLLGWRMGPGPL